MRKLCCILTIVKFTELLLQSLSSYQLILYNGYSFVQSGKCSVQNGEAGVLEPTLSFEERYKAGILKVAATIKDGRYQFGCSI